MYGIAEDVVPRIFARTHQHAQTPWVAIVFTTIIALLIVADVDTLASATVVPPAASSRWSAFARSSCAATASPRNTTRRRRSCW